VCVCGPCSPAGIASRYGLDSPGIESRCGRDFLHPFRPALGPTQPPIQWVPCLSRGVKRPGRGVDHPPTFSAEVKERVELYMCSPFEPSWPVLGWTLLLSLITEGYQTQDFLRGIQPEALYELTGSAAPLTGYEETWPLLITALIRRLCPRPNDIGYQITF
jgi:hypothetical protein